jgi:hypothetical protein
MCHWLRNCPVVHLVAIVLCPDTSSAHPKGFLEGTFGGWCEPLCTASLRQICGIIVAREFGTVGGGEGQLCYLRRPQLASVAINCDYDDQDWV